MQKYDFSASYVPHARFGYKKTENYTLDGDFITLHGWIYQNLIELKNPENIVFVCKKYYYLMVGCPETMQMKDPRDKNASWTDCKLEIAERSKFSIYDLDMNLIRSAQYSDSMKGVDTGGRLEYIYITPGSVPEEKKPDEKPVSYNMVLKSDLLINSYSLTKEYKMTSVSFGYVLLIFDSTREKLISADVSISGSGTESWRYDDRYADAMKDVIQGSGSENKGVSFGMTLRAPD